MEGNKEIVSVLTVAYPVSVTVEDIDDIMSAALDGGICYWCCKAEVVGGKYFGEYASEQIARGGSLKLYDAESDDVWELTCEKFLFGLRTWAEHHPENLEFDGEFYRVDVGDVDAVAADRIVQIALFGKEVFG